MPLFRAATCLSCIRRCNLQEETAFCGAYRWTGDAIENMAWGQVAAWSLDAIEKKPVHHYRPGTRVLSLGSWGCSFRCAYCLNADLAWRRSAPQEVVHRWAPDEVVVRARDLGAEGIAWTFNEAATWLPFVIATNHLAREAGLYTVLVTNGAYPDEALDELLPTLDVWRVDVKGWTDELYRELLGVTHPARTVRHATERARQAGCHVEVVTCIVPGHHDDWEALAPLAAWIRDALGAETPWHLLPFHPQHRMRDETAFPRERLHAHLEAARTTGLLHVFPGRDGDRGTSGGRQRHYDFRGPRGEFARVSIDMESGTIGFVGDPDLLDEVLDACGEEGTPLSVLTRARCG